jgi:hypothetical protein
VLTELSITEESLSDLRQSHFEGVFESHIEGVVHHDATFLRAQHHTSRARLLAGTGRGGRSEVVLAIECELAVLVLDCFVVLFREAQHGLYERLVFLTATHADGGLVNLDHTLYA